MAYSVANPPALKRDTIGGLGGIREWDMLGTDAVTTVRVTGYISNAKVLGMQKGDLVRYVKTDASPIAMQFFIVSAINTDGSADLSDGTAITATNTD
jgi:hypothetical protein